MTVRSGSADSAAAAAAARARAEAARRAAEAARRAAEQRARAAEAKARADAQQTTRTPASAETQQASRTRAVTGEHFAAARLRGATSPDAIARNQASQAKTTADTATTEARDASQRASTDSTAADRAFSEHQQAERAVNEARERNAPPTEMRPLEQRADEAKTAFEEAERRAQTSADVAVREADEALSAQQAANDKARAAGTEPPFAAADEVQNVSDLAKAPPAQQREILGRAAGFTEHDVTRSENRAEAREAEAAVEPRQRAAQAAHEEAAAAETRTGEAQSTLASAREDLSVARRAGAHETELARLQGRVNGSERALETARSEETDAKKTAHERTESLLQSQRAANEAARDAGDPPPFAEASKAASAEDVAGLSAADQRAILGTESAIGSGEAAHVAGLVRADRVDASAARVNGASTDPQRAAELLNTELASSSDPAFRRELLEATAPAQEAIGARLTSDDLSRDDAQALTNELARAGELAGQDNARTLTDGVAAGMSGDRLRGEVKDALEQSVTDGHGALFGVELAQSLQETGKAGAARDVLEKTKHGIENVREEFANRQDDALALEGQLAGVKEQWAASGAFTPAQIAAGEAEFRSHHAETLDGYAEQSERLASTLNGADAAMRAYEDPNGSLRNIDNAEGRKINDVAQEAMGHAPDLVYSQAGQQALGEAAIDQGRGSRTWLQGANEHASRLEGDDKSAYEDRIASATMQAAVSGMDQLADSGHAGERSLAVRGAADAMGNPSPGSLAAEMQGGLRDIQEQVRSIETSGEAFNPIKAGEDLASGIDRVIGARFDAVASRQPDGQLDNAQRAARDRLSLVGTAASVAGLGQATYNLITDPGLQTAAQVASSGLDLASTAGEAEVLRRGRELGFRDDQLTNATRPLRALALGGAAIGLFTASDTQGRIQAGVETAVDGAGLIGGLSAFGTGASGARAAIGTGLRAVGKASLVVGIGFSAIDTYQAIQRGDTVGALAAGAPIAGAAIGFGVAAAAAGSVAPGVGTAIGFAVGSLVGLGIGIARNVFSDSPDETFEKTTEPFLRGALREAGLPEDAAHRLRDVDGDFEGMARALPALAAATNTTPREILERVTQLPDSQLEDFVKEALKIPHNGEEIADARRENAEGGNVTVPEFAVDQNDFHFHTTVAMLNGLR